MIYLVFLLIFSLCYSSDADIPDKYFNWDLEQANSSSNSPPPTVAKPLEQFKFSYGSKSKTVFDGGWTRPVTKVDLPIATDFVSVQTRLEKNAIRELHWHNCAEYGYVIHGDARVTLVDPSGNSFVDDVTATDVWFFPRGYPHSIQGTGCDGVFFLSVLYCGDFNVPVTYNLLDWINLLPRNFLAANFETEESTFKKVRNDAAIFRGKAPRPLAVEQAQAANGTGTVPQPFTFSTSSIDPQVVRTGGTAKLILQSIFPVEIVTLVIITLYPGGINELHWHPNANEYQYYLYGNGRMNVFGGDGRSLTLNFTAGDVGYVKANQGHYIQNTCDEELVILAWLSTTDPETVTMAQWLAHEPSCLVNEHLRCGEDFINSIYESLGFIIPL